MITHMSRVINESSFYMLELILLKKLTNLSRAKLITSLKIKGSSLSSLRKSKLKLAQKLDFLFNCLK